MKALDIEVIPGELLSAVPADTVVVPVPKNERPLRGPAGRLDWRLCGRISEELLSGGISGAAHEAMLLAGRPPIRAPRVMLLGVGGAEMLPGRGVQDAFRDLTARLLGLCSSCAVLALPAAIDLEQDAEGALRGCLQSLSSHRGDVSLRLVLTGALPLMRALTRAIDALADEAQRRRVHVEVHAGAPEVLSSQAAPSASHPTL